MSKKYTVICADPPFGFSDQLKMSDVKRGASANYNTMTISDIKDMKVKDLIDPTGSVLALWVPSSLLQDGLDIMKSWGFDFKQMWVWVKIKKEPFKKIKNKKNIDFEKINWDDFISFGLGRLGRNVHEIALIGISGKIYKKLKNKSQRTVFFYQNTKHSKKPEILQDKLEIMFPTGNYLEIFGRRSRKNWDVIGNEAPATYGENITESIKNLL